MTTLKKSKILKTLSTISFIPSGSNFDEFTLTAKKCNCKSWEVEEVDRYYHLINGVAVNHTSGSRV